MNHLIVNADLGTSVISKYIYGHFSEHLGRCIYEGYWVGEDSPIPNTRGVRNDVVAALRRVKPSVLRWPGGCFADEYHWMDGVGPREARPSMVNTHWGYVTEDNQFGTHEFFDLCELIGADPYVCGNVGSGGVQEMQQWVEYITFDVGPMAHLRRKHGREQPWKLPFFGVGNESYGCGGCMRPEYYADIYRRYQTYVRNHGDARIYKIACGPPDDDYHWTEVLMREAARHMNGLSLHYYTIIGSWDKKGSAVDFDESQWFATLKKALVMDELVSRHSSIMHQYDPEKRVGLIVDEWGTWFDVEEGTSPHFLYQQNTMRDALVAGLTLNIFNAHCTRVKMANIAQTVNVLQALILTEGERVILTPTYHVFDLYQVHQGATLLPILLDTEPYSSGAAQIPQVSASASRDAGGVVHITLCNADPHHEARLSCELRGMTAAAVSGRVLAAKTMQAHNTLDNPEAVTPVEYTGARTTDQGLDALLPPMSIVQLAVRGR